jgi:hydrogenase/urease accessory protein HupE
LPIIAYAHGISDEDKQRMLDGGYIQYMWLGASHMLTGYDHLLFLLGVVFLLSTFKDIVKFVTVFTIGHCITLIFATYFKITWNFWLVDAIIAVSVIYKGFDNNNGFQRHFNMASHF